MIEKDSLLLETVGSIDELQSVLELIGFEDEIVDDLKKIMSELVCGGTRCQMSDVIRLRWTSQNSGCQIEERVRFLENEIEKMKNKLPKINKFLKFKGKKALELNWARTVCRRVERRAIALNRQKKISEDVLNYLNRLSSYLFLKAVERN